MLASLIVPVGPCLTDHHPHVAKLGRVGAKCPQKTLIILAKSVERRGKDPQRRRVFPSKIIVVVETGTRIERVDEKSVSRGCRPDNGVGGAAPVLARLLIAENRSEERRVG